MSYEPLLVGLRILCVAKKGETIVDARNSYGGSVGLSAFEEEANTPEKIAEATAKWAIEKLKAKTCPSRKI